MRHGFSSMKSDNIKFLHVDELVSVVSLQVMEGWVEPGNKGLCKLQATLSISYPILYPLLFCINFYRKKLGGGLCRQWYTSTCVKSSIPPLPYRSSGLGVTIE